MRLKTRLIEKDLGKLHARERGRLVVLTGARQTGKSTLARAALPDYPAIDLDSPVERAFYATLGANDWFERYPRAIIDEAQKLPEIFETIKACYDRYPDARYVLLGSSQVLLMRQVRETLAGRAALRELYPYTLPELVAEPEVDLLGDSRFATLVTAADPGTAMRTLFPAEVAIAPSAARARAVWTEFLAWGGMPVLWHDGWTDTDRFEWLADYHATYLQRDLTDLARLDRLEPFVRAQKAAALRTAQTINFSELARVAGVSPPTARQFLRYLEISYQVVLLQGWYRNPNKRLVKQPKLHFVDPGIRRAILRKRGAVDGQEFESAVVAEIVKQCRTLRLPVDLHHLRTQDGREVDLLIEREDGYIAVECKLAERVAKTDFRHLVGLGALLDKPLLLGVVVSSDPRPQRVANHEPLWKVEAAALFSSPTPGARS